MRPLLLALALCVPRADAVELLKVEPPPPPEPVETAPPSELEVPVLATWEGKPLVGGKLMGKLCDVPMSIPDRLDYRTDYKGRATMKFLVTVPPEKGWDYKVCLTLYSPEGVELARAEDVYVVGSGKPARIGTAGRLVGAGAGAAPLDEKAEVDALKALRRGSAKDRAIAASLMARRKNPPLSLIPVAAEALQGEYDAGAPASSKYTRADLIEGLRRYHFYHAGRTAALRRAAKEDPDERLRKLAAGAPSLKP
jgi:hypothetical protein